jgi:archaellum component FlaC
VGETVSEQVVRVLVPLMKELKAEIRGVKEDISQLNESVNGLRETVSSLEQHTNKTVSELSGVQSTLNISITSNTQQLSHIKYLMDTLDLKLCSVNDTVVSTLETVSNINETVSNVDCQQCQ